MTKAETNDGIVLIEESMEPRKRRQAGASKSKKKGGKPHTRSAAEEAKRREVLKETLRERLELERRALQVVERLLDDNVTEEFLIDCAQLITPANYRDTVEERSIVRLCGYPICPNKLSYVPTQQYKISTRTNKVYDITERKCFCSNFCYKASKFFEVQISKSPLWLRKEERPADVKLMKKEDGGSSGLEVPLMDRAVRAEEVENPTSEAAERLGDVAGESGGSDEEQEDFVSSVVARQRMRVHWGELPRLHEGSEKDQRLEGDMKDTRAQCLMSENGRDGPSHWGELPRLHEGSEKDQRLEGDTKDTRAQCLMSENGRDGPSQSSLPHGDHGCPALQSKVTPVECAVELLDQCVLPDNRASGVTPQDPVNGASQKVSDVNTDVRDTPDTGLNICQVGMSRRGATGLKSLLKNHTRAKADPPSVKEDLLEHLRCTLLEWRTEETLKFLYGPDYTSQTDAPLPTEEEEEELDEDDLEDLEGGSEKANQCREQQARPSSAAPDYHTLTKNAKVLDLGVREFYKGTRVLPEQVKPDTVEEAKNSQASDKTPALLLVDSQAPHVIQKRIVVEKLSRSLRDVVGPLRLTMSEIINDINILVRTFRFTNVNISHKPPEWTLIAVVLLSVLTEVSPLLRASMVKPSSVEYITSLMKALRLKDQDLQNLVELFKPKGPSTHSDI